MFWYNVVLNVDMFGAGMELGNPGNWNCPLIVNVDVLHLCLVLPGSEVL